MKFPLLVAAMLFVSMIAVAQQEVCELLLMNLLLTLTVLLNVLLKTLVKMEEKNNYQLRSLQEDVLFVKRTKPFLLLEELVLLKKLLILRKILY